jgi:hypothetical protein
MMGSYADPAGSYVFIRAAARQAEVSGRQQPSLIRWLPSPTTSSGLMVSVCILPAS